MTNTDGFGSDIDWVDRLATQLIQRLPRGKQAVVASGISPSGPVHLGNLREVITGHLVADELKSRGIACEHILSWDDFDRLRKTPAEIPAEYARHIGKPLCDVPAPPGSRHLSWAEHFRADLELALEKLGIEVRPISQSRQYRAGVYRRQIFQALDNREFIAGVIARFQTRPKTEDYWPYTVYCSRCKKDSTRIISYDRLNLRLAYACACGFEEEVDLTTFSNGKLPWKVDWPMRWQFEGVDFEPGGVDHCAPGSASMGVASQLVEEVFDGRIPLSVMYAFVGVSGAAKMSSSRGGAPTPLDALEVMEAPVLRWMYARRRPNQSFSVAFDRSLHRLYDEWDALNREVAVSRAKPEGAQAWRRATLTSVGPLALTPRPIPYKTLASVVEITAGSADQLLRVARDLEPGLASISQLQPRLDCARYWTQSFLPPDERTRVLVRPREDFLASLDEKNRRALELLGEELELDWSLAGLTALVYGLPKRMSGLALDAPATPELKRSQREFFGLLYDLLLGRDTGPRLPTLLLATGPEKIRELLGL